MQSKDHIHLLPIDVSYDEVQKNYNDGDMNPALLDHKELRKEVTGGSYKMMKKIAEVSNQIWFEILMLKFQMGKN